MPRRGKGKGKGKNKKSFPNADDHNTNRTPKKSPDRPAISADDSAKIRAIKRNIKDCFERLIENPSVNSMPIGERLQAISSDLQAKQFDNKKYALNFPFKPNEQSFLEFLFVTVLEHLKIIDDTVIEACIGLVKVALDGGSSLYNRAGLPLGSDIVEAYLHKKNVLTYDQSQYYLDMLKEEKVLQLRQQNGCGVVDRLKRFECTVSDAWGLDIDAKISPQRIIIVQDIVSQYGDDLLANVKQETGIGLPEDEFCCNEMSIMELINMIVESSALFLVVRQQGQLVYVAEVEKKGDDFHINPDSVNISWFKDKNKPVESTMPARKEPLLKKELLFNKGGTNEFSEDELHLLSVARNEDQTQDWNIKIKNPDIYLSIKTYFMDQVKATGIVYHDSICTMVILRRDRQQMYDVIAGIRVVISEYKEDQPNFNGLLQAMKKEDPSLSLFKPKIPGEKNGPTISTAMKKC